jgi:N-acylneuraminate cytidylyltransferase
MISWSIQAAIDSHSFDAILVSTDDEEIASIARDAGAVTPFLRPKEISGDHTAVMPVLAHAVEWWCENRFNIDFACCIYATAPFINPTTLSNSLELLTNTDADFVLAVTKFNYPVQRSLRLDDQNLLKFVEPENALARSQDLETRYHDAGQFFAGRRNAFIRNESVLRGRCLPVVVAKDEAVDIDTEEDWRIAEKLFLLRSYPKIKID